MNILFVGKRSLQESAGVERKLDNQMAALRALGHQVWYTCATPQGCFLYGGDQPVLLAPYKNYFPAPLSDAKNNGILLLEAARYTGVEFDLCYIRKPLCDKRHIQALQTLQQRGVVVIEEIPTYPYDAELLGGQGIGPRVYLAIDRHYRKQLHRVLNYIASYSVDKTIFGLPVIPMENAVNVSQIPLGSYQPAPDGSLRIMAISSMFFWHGYQRLIQGLAQYRQQNPQGQKIFIHMVGDGPEKNNWMALAKKLDVEDCVFFHGMQGGAPLDRLFDQTDIAIGSLGWYLKGMGDLPTYEIKIREYIARGKPVLYACNDPHALAIAPYSLALPNDDTPVDMTPVVDFWKRIQKDDYAPALRLYAQQHLQWESQMQKIIDAYDAIKGANL